MDTRIVRPGLQIRVNLAQCTGAGDCVRVCPEVFVMDRYGYPIVQHSVDMQDRQLRSRIIEARTRCPEQAIVVETLQD
ncbi:ferredoxin [Mycobacterium sp.]|jgi:ferredoxin|uniref:ferredoxin n=1 Tax=Mycobacterium sp. TaxID=1785 RepID=UPI002C610CB0|nr:ferredoxin [Mycobacterium sp.]HXB88212.1 ferredoxin [Mycobacterium sp.]